jgi:hypothetical protein
MSTARSILLVSAGMALGVAAAMAAGGNIDFARQIDAFRSADRGTRPAAPPETPTPPPNAIAPPPTVESAPETVVVTLPNASAPGASQWTRPATGDRLSLAQELQGELQRVGCYVGNIDGIWTPLSQKAMKAFTERVNARLPVDEPDYVLLALVRGRQDKVCVNACPPGQSLTADNGCVPDAILPRAAKPVLERTPAALSRSTIAFSPSSPTDVRMAPARPGSGTNPAATIAQTPGQPGAAPGVTPPVPQQKQKSASKKPSPGPFGTDIFKLLISGY